MSKSDEKPKQLQLRVFGQIDGGAAASKKTEQSALTAKDVKKDSRTASEKEVAVYKSIADRYFKSET